MTENDREDIFSALERDVKNSSLPEVEKIRCLKIFCIFVGLKLTL